PALIASSLMAKKQRRLAAFQRLRRAQYAGAVADGSHTAESSPVLFPPSSLSALLEQLDPETRQLVEPLFRPLDPEAPDPIEKAIRLAGPALNPSTNGR